MSSDTAVPGGFPRKRRPRYSGKNPRRYDQKYKEQNPQHHPETIAKVLAAGKTPAGTHRPILVAEILEVLQPVHGNFAVDCTLGHGGHSVAILEKIMPGGRLLAIDSDPLEMARTEKRLREAGFDSSALRCSRSNFTALPRLLCEEERTRADLILADLGVSSMQIDDPSRGFSIREDGPLDMRMNPTRGRSAAEFIATAQRDSLADILTQNSDEPFSAILAHGLAGRLFESTHSIARAIRTLLHGKPSTAVETSIRRVFQAIRIEVNDEFGALEILLRNLPNSLVSGGRVAILSFHSGEDRRVKKAFELGLQSGLYTNVSSNPVQAGPEERRQNTRSSAAKLRWAVRSEKPHA